MTVISNFISDQMIHSLGWTLIHSLWQGSLIALIYFLFTRSFENIDSRRRYNLGILSLIILMGTAGITFWKSFRSYIPISPASPSDWMNLGGADLTPSTPTLFEWLQGFFNQHLTLIVGIWMIGVLILVAHFTKDCCINHKIRKYHGKPIKGIWEKRLSNLSKKMGVKKIIPMVETACATVPMTIGHLKPIIFFPFGFIAGIPANQVEAILAHELAHILRCDYLINILQSFVDIVFFFHPGVRWLSNNIRTEREICCDDIAVEVMGDSVNMANALANVGKWQTQHPRLAMNATGKKEQLFQRIRRVSKMKQKGTRSSEGLISACVLGLLLVFVGIGANSASLAPEKRGEKVKVLAKSFLMEQEGTIQLMVSSDEPGVHKCYILDKQGTKVADLDEKLHGKPFKYKFNLNLKAGEYTLYQTKNCRIKLKKGIQGGHSAPPAQILQRYHAKMNELKSKGRNMSQQEKEKLLKLKELAKQLEKEMQLKSLKIKQVMEKLYKKRQIILDKNSRTTADQDDLKKIELMIKEYEKKLQEFQSPT